MKLEIGTYYAGEYTLEVRRVPRYPVGTEEDPQGVQVTLDARGICLFNEEYSTLPSWKRVKKDMARQNLADVAEMFSDEYAG